MVAPRDIPVVIVLEHVHDLVRTGTTVIDVTENMKLVDGEALDDICNSDDEGIGPSCIDDRVDDDVDVSSLVRILRTLMEQFLNDIGEVLGQ